MNNFLMNLKEDSTRQPRWNLKNQTSLNKDRRPKGDDVDISPWSDDERWEKVSKKPGNDSLGGFLFHYLEVKRKL